MSELEALKARLSQVGLNVAGVADPKLWDEKMPEARKSATLLPKTQSILVFGSGGGSLWDAFLADLRAEPRYLSEEQHPLDAFVRRAVEKADSLLGTIQRRWFYAAATAELHLDFRVLAQLAGLGGQSRTGLLLHPEYGLWLGLRAACFLDLPLSPSTPDSNDPCFGCPGFCASACPGLAFSGGRWSVDACASFKNQGDRCKGNCDAREACPKGKEHQYSREEILYHSDRASGRPILKTLVGVDQDSLQGIGPFWGDWRKRINVNGE
jgi:epoxyqueuosine reductase QueG